MERLGSSLVLTEVEDAGVSLPTTAWAGSREGDELLVVGRLLTMKAYRFDVLEQTLQNILRPIRGMVVSRLPKNRFLIQFKHVVDRDRVMNGGPWFFDKNLIILSRVLPEENPLNVELNWCAFHVFIHDLPIRMMTRKAVEYIGNRLGVFLDSDHEQAQFKWGAKFRIQVSLDVRNPLTRALRLRSMGRLQMSPIEYGGSAIGKLTLWSWLRESREVRFNSMVGDTDAEAGEGVMDSSFHGQYPAGDGRDRQI
ncbi:UNVERIFIED_CONTAM: hypothetical protein Slati_2130500 [Sesamum latifolium]|uniref:DUF4283 domain-containing protein n=1 Tax=Sesamum latifolium TaxID=2727402 RepID=A0AAW2WRP9_9LAMI